MALGLTHMEAKAMGPRKVAEYMRANLSPEEQVKELQGMLAAGGLITNLAHGIAVELKIAEHEELKGPLVESLKFNPKDVVVGYGEQVGRNASERSPFAGKGPMFARMEDSQSKAKAAQAGDDSDAAEEAEPAADDADD
jgi:hypothetical protein